MWVRVRMPRDEQLRRCRRIACGGWRREASPACGRPNAGAAPRGHERSQRSVAGAAIRRSDLKSDRRLRAVPASAPRECGSSSPCRSDLTQCWCPALRSDAGTAQRAGSGPATPGPAPTPCFPRTHAKLVRCVRLKRCGAGRQRAALHNNGRPQQPFGRVDSSPLILNSNYPPFVWPPTRCMRLRLDDDMHYTRYIMCAVLVIVYMYRIFDQKCNNLNFFYIYRSNRLILNRMVQGVINGAAQIGSRSFTQRPGVDAGFVFPDGCFNPLLVDRCP